MRKFIGVLLSIVLITSMASLIAVPTMADESVTCGFETAAGWNSGMIGKAGAYRFDGSACLFFNPRLNALGDDTTYISQESGYSNGTRRSKLMSLSGTAKAGAYDISVYIAENAQILENGAVGIMLTFHDSTVTDATLKHQWNDSALNKGVVMVVDTYTGENNGGFDNYTSAKAELVKGGTATGVDGNTWTEYRGTVKLTGDATQIAGWLYLWAGYNTAAPAATNQNIYIDGLTMTSHIVHTPGEAVKENEVAATCSAEGTYDEVVYCTACGEEISRTEKKTEKLAHTPGEAVIENEQPSSCSAGGTYDEVVYCTVCGEEISRTTKSSGEASHTPAEPVRENEVAATCAAEGSYDEVVYCSVCGSELSRETKTTEKLSTHTPADHVHENEVAATCAAEGSYDEVVYCSVCGSELSRETKTVAKLTTHTPANAVKENVVPSQVGVKGSYDEVVYCSVCGEELSRTAVETPAIEKLVGATCPFEGVGGWNSGLIGKASAYHFDGSNAVFFSPKLNALGDGTTFVNDTCGYSNGTRRAVLAPLSNKVTAGTYKVSIYVAENAEILENGDVGILLTFHDASVTDAALKLQWNNESLNSGVVMVVDTFTGSDNGGFDAYKGSKAELKASGKKATGDDGYTWYEYTGTVTLTGDATQVAAWLYMWAGYNPDGTAPASDNENIYIDSLRLTPLGSADTVDYVSVFAAAGVVALVGTTVAVKIRKKEE